MIVLSVALLRRPALLRILAAGGSSCSCCPRQRSSRSTGRLHLGVNNEHVVETTLGYFINPLVTVLMGVLILGERMRVLQWVAMGVAAPRSWG